MNSAFRLPAAGSCTILPPRSAPPFRPGHSPGLGSGPGRGYGAQRAHHDGVHRRRRPGSGHLLGGAWTYVAGGYAGRKDVQVLAVCDVWRERRERACQKVNDHYAEAYGKGNYKSCEAYTDFRQVLERADIDAVLIATPAHWHATMAAMAAAAGKDIYCEKPSAVTVRESQAMLAAVRRYGRVYQAGTQQRSEYDGKFRRACEFVRSGRIGKLQAIYAYRDGGAVFWPKRFGPAKPLPADLDWDLYLGPAPWIPYDGNTSAHRFDIGELNWGQHHYDIVQWAARADETGPVELFMENGRSCYKYASGVVVYGKAYPGENVGGDGGACFVGTGGRIAVDRDALVSDPPNIVREPLRPDEVHLYRSTRHADNFLECVRTRKQSDLRRRHRPPGSQRAAAGRCRQTVAAPAQVGSAGRAIRQGR